MNIKVYKEVIIYMNVLQISILLIIIVVTGSVISGMIKTYQALYEIYNN